MKSAIKATIMFALCATLSLAAGIALAQSDAQSLEEAKKDAANLLQQGKYDSACTTLEKYADDGYDPQLTFLIGQCKFGMLDYSAAAFQYQLMLEKNTNLPRVRTELARTLAAMGKSKAAKEEYEKILSGDLPEPVRQNIVAQVKQIDERKRWGGVFSLGYMYDSNVNSAPSDPNIKAFNLPFVLNDESTDQSDNAMVGSVSIGKYFDWWLADEWRFDAYGNMTKYSEEDQYDSYSLGMSIGPNFYSNAQLSLPVGASISWEDGKRASQSASFSPSWSKALTARLRLSTQASFSYYDDLRSSDESNGWSKGLSGNLQYSLTRNKMIELGLSALDNDANELDYNRYISKTISLGWHTSVLNGIRMSFQPSYTKLDYNSADPVDAGLTREDDRYSINTNIYKEVSIGGFSFTPVLAFTWTKNDSNIERRDFHRRQVMLQLRKQL